MVLAFRKLPFLLLVLSMPLCVTGCKKKAEAAPEVQVSVKAEHPFVGPISEEITADAVLAPLAQAALSPRISSPIRAEYVQRGAHVHRGQLLITLEDRDLQGQALDSKGNLTTAQASYTAATQATIPEDLQKAELDVEQTRAAADVATGISEERKRLVQQGALAGRDADTAYAASVQARTAYDLALKHLQTVRKTIGATTAQSAEGQLASAKGKYASAEAQVSYASLRSPMDGIVTERPLFVGETATAGTPILTIMDTSSLLAKLHLAQSVTQQLKIGGTAEVEVSGVEESVAATVSFISPTTDAGSTTVEVWLKLPNPTGRFKVGTAAHVVIRGITLQNALQVPPAALLPAEDGGVYLMVAGVDGLAHKRPVKTGIRTAKKVQITHGLLPGDNVVIDGGYGLDEGTKLTLGTSDANGKTEDKD